MRLYTGFFFFLVTLVAHSQQQQDTLVLDSKYVEDQFYLGLSYNFVRDTPEGFSQRNLSYGLMGGFIKDMPLNANRTFALGVGSGLSFNAYYSNLVVRTSALGQVYALENDIKRSRLETYLIEFPLEIRWRNSTPEEYKFWRIYAGVKAAYLIKARSIYSTGTLKEGFFNEDVANFQYGLTLSFGYNTFNLHAYYALQNLFKDNVRVDGEVLQYKPLRIGLIFYIL